MELTAVTNSPHKDTFMYVPMFKKLPSIRIFRWIVHSISLKNTVLTCAPAPAGCPGEEDTIVICDTALCSHFLSGSGKHDLFFKARCSYCSYTLIIAKSGLKQLVKCYFVLSMKMLSHISQSAHISWWQHDWGGPWAFFIMLSLTITPTPVSVEAKTPTSDRALKTYNL